MSGTKTVEVVKAKGWCCLPQSRQPSAPLPPDAPLQVIQETLFNQGTRAATFLCRDRLDVGCMSPDTSQFSILDTVPPDLKREVLQLASMEPNAVRAMGAMVGMAVADSVGAFLEFLPVGKKGSRFNPQTLKVEGSFNKFKLKPGQWTDDTSMALCLADSLLVCEGYDGADIRVRFWNWWHRGYNNAFRRDKGRHASVGLGGNVAQSLKDVQNNSPSPRFESTSQDAGNGSLMRLAPVPIFFSSTCEKAAALSEESSRTTHPGKVAAAACHFLGFFLSKAISRGADPSESAAQFLSKVVEDYLTWPWSSAINRKLARVLRSEPSTDGREQCWNWRDPKGPFLEETLDARGSSYNGYPVSPNYVGSFCLDGLAMAMHSFYHTTSFMEAMTCCVNFLGDADSTGAICGQMAGAFYGLSAIDPRLIQRLRRWDRDEIAFRAALLFSCGQGYAIRECLKELSGGARRPTLLESGKKSEAKANKEPPEPRPEPPEAVPVDSLPATGLMTLDSEGATVRGKGLCYRCQL